MPYITQEKRTDIQNGKAPSNSGELNYTITKLIQSYLNDMRALRAFPNYGDINEVIGVLECCKLELYRRIAVPYEDNKIEQNGDVY